MYEEVWNYIHQYNVDTMDPYEERVIEDMLTFHPGWYTPEEILELADEEDVIIVDGLSYERDELKVFPKLRYYRSDGNHHMFTMTHAYN